MIEGAIAFCRVHPDVRYCMPPSGEPLIPRPESVDGVLTIATDAKVVRSLQALGKPVVNVSTVNFEVPFPSVVTDNREIGALAADHLLALGYAGFACHMESRVRYSVERIEGFRARLREAGREAEVFDSSPSAGAPSDPAALREATVEWLRGLRKPVGLMSHNDARASGLLMLCRDAGLRVPEEVGIVGVDDDAFLDESCRPTLSSIDNAPSVVGFRAAEMLAAILRGGSPPSPVLIAPRRVVQRHSTQVSLGDDPVLERAVRAIRQRAFEAVAVGEILREIPLSRRSLERAFRRRLGRAPADELLRIRIDRAKALLVDTDMAVGRIAEAVGYGQSRNFSTAFRREVGAEPSAYRAAYRLRGGT